MSELLIHTRIIPPKPPVNIVSRERLVEQLRQNILKSIILICCPAGYGKTTLVLDFLYRYHVNFAWFRVTEDITDFYTFISYIIYSLRNLRNDFGKNTLEVLDSLKESLQLARDLETIITTALGTFVNEYTSVFADDNYLVIDDLHNVEGTDWLNSTFNELIKNLPPNLHVIITTRRKPGFKVSGLEAKRNIFKLGVEDLSFDLSETRKLLHETYSIDYGEEDLKFFDEKIKGWVTGIHLILQAYGQDYNKISSEKIGISDNLFNYFADEIFSQLDSKTQNFLLYSSLLDSFTSEICDWLMDINCSNRIIEQLVNKNIFIEYGERKADNINTIPTSTFSYHTLFKQYLISKLHVEKDENEIIKILNKIYTYYLNKGDLPSAINYALACKNYDSIVSLLSETYQRLFDEGKYELLWKWLNDFPAELVWNDKRLLFYKGNLYKYFEADIEKAEKYFLRFMELPRTEAEQQLFIDCSIQYSDILILKGKPGDSVLILKSIIDIETTPSNRVRLLYQLANAYYRIGVKEYTNIISILENCLKICEEHQLKTLQIDVYSLLGNVYLDRGEFVKSLFYYEHAVKKVTNVYRKFLNITNVIHLYSLSGNYLKAKEYLDEAEKLFKKFPSVLFERFLLRSSANFRFECSDYEECINIYKRLASLDIKNNIKHYVFWYYLLIGEAYFLSNQLENADQYFQLAFNYVDEKDEYEKMEYDLHIAILQKEKRLVATIEKVMLNAREYYENNFMLYSKVQVDFHLADYYYKMHHLDTALIYLSRSLKTSVEKQYVSFLEQNFLHFRYLFDLALVNGIESDFIRNIIENVTDRRNFGWISSECRKRIMCETDKLFDIKLNTFGGIEMLVRGRLIPENIWIRKKSKLILVYLLLNPTIKLTKEIIFDIFFQDLSQESAENIFHQSITNIRNAIKIYPSHPAVKTKSKARIQNSYKSAVNSLSCEQSFVCYEDKLLHLNPSCYYYVDALEFNLLYNKAKSAELDDLTKIDCAERAVDMYKGEFLAGIYEQWCEEMRGIYTNKFIQLCEELINIYKNQDKFYEVIKYTERLLQVDNLHEEAYIDSIESYVKLNNINMAKSKLAAMLKIFKEEYGETPSKAAMDRIQRILLESELLYK